MKERTKTEHIRFHKDNNIDYILTHDYALQKEVIKSIGEVKIFENQRLIEVILSLTTELKKLGEESKEQKETIEQLTTQLFETKQVIDKIIKEKLKL